MRLIQYIKDTKGEMKHVSWPTKHQATAYTILVIVLSLAVAGYLGLFDWLFTTGLDAMISNNSSTFDPSELISTTTDTSATGTEAIETDIEIN